MSETVETRGNHRAVIHLDPDPHAPDGDFFGYVFRLDRWGCDLLGKAHGTPDQDTFNMREAWERYRDMDLVTRYLRAFYDVVGVDYFDTQDAKIVNVVTRDDLKLWGWEPDEPATWPNPDPTVHNLDEWRAYVDGDVYFYTVERAVQWTTDDPDHEGEELTTWEEVDSCGGYYGRQWAEESAREALGAYDNNNDEHEDATCHKCGGQVRRFDPDGGLWVGNLPAGGSYDCPKGGLHEVH